MEASEINRLNINKPKIDLQEKIENDNNEKEEKISRNIVIYIVVKYF